MPVDSNKLIFNTGGIHFFLYISHSLVEPLAMTKLLKLVWANTQETTAHKVIKGMC